MGSYVSCTATTPGIAVTTPVGEDQANAVLTIVTVPIVGYVAGDKQGGDGPSACTGSFSA